MGNLHSQNGISWAMQGNYAQGCHDLQIFETANKKKIRNLQKQEHMQFLLLSDKIETSTIETAKFVPLKQENQTIQN